MTNRKLNIIISGQKRFGKEVLKLAIEAGHQVKAVVCPLDDNILRPYAEAAGLPTIPAGTLTHDTMPAGIDLGICAHSFDYIGRKTRYKASIGWIGYHPSLLPRHRGKSSIEWALRMKDVITGGTVYWLNDGIDRGDIACQDWIWLDHNKSAKRVWDDELMPMGITLLKHAFTDIAQGRINRIPQKEYAQFSTFEPSLTGIKDIYRPDLLMIDMPKQ